jgi:hypothetical protein
MIAPDLGQTKKSAPAERSAHSFSLYEIGYCIKLNSAASLAAYNP